MPLRIMISVLVAAAAVQGARGDDEAAARRAELARYFGFGTMHIYRINPGIRGLRLADLDGDGRTDILLFNPMKSRFELMLQPDPHLSRPPAGSNLERNELPDRGSLVRERVPVTYRVAASGVADFTGDGRPDIVFFGEPRELVILPGREGGGFGSPITTRAPEGDPRGNTLAVGDFNSDGLADVAILGDGMLLVFHQRPGGGLEAPLKLVHNVPQTLLLLAGDFNGDGRDDLIVAVDDEREAAMVFLQDDGGTLGAARRARLPRVRSMTVWPRDGADELLCVELATGRLRHLVWQTEEKLAAEADWPRWLYSYPVQSRGKQQPVAIGDVDGDGYDDVVVVDPDAAQMFLFRGSEHGLRQPLAFPTLVKTTDVCIGDFDGDGAAEVLCASQRERMIGVSRFADGRLTYPQALPNGSAEFKPLAVAVGPLRTGGASTLAYVANEKDDGAERERCRLRVLLPDGSWATADVGELKDEPAGLRFADVNQDGLTDLLLFVRFATAVTFIQTADGRFERLDGRDARTELLRDARPEAFELADVTGDGRQEILLAQENLVRALVVRDGRWVVVDQYSAERSDAEISGVAVIPAGSGDRPQLALFDRKSRELVVLESSAGGTYSVSRRMPVGEFDLTAMRAAALAPGRQPAILMADARKLALVLPGLADATLVERHSYETDIRDAVLGDAAVGDVNGDGVPDVVTVDQRRAHLEVLTTLPGGELAKVLAFQVFRGKRFSYEPDFSGDPREVLVGDVTGDGVDDVVVIVHDRVIVYPGE